MSRGAKRQAGFIVSTEMMLISLVLVLGLVTAWVKLRDQSLSELADTMAAIDAYIMGSTPQWQMGGTRWIATGAADCANAGPDPCIVGPAGNGGVVEKWGDVNVPASLFTAPAVNLPAGGIYTKKDGFLVYGTVPGEGGGGGSSGETP